MQADLFRRADNWFCQTATICRKVRCLYFLIVFAHKLSAEHNYGGRNGKDTITDFQNGEDKIDLKAFNFASKAQALAKFYEIGSGNNDKLGFNFKGTEIVVKGIDMGDLNGADIII